MLKHSVCCCAAACQIEFLEVRLAEVMAYADIPINMRPALTELTAGSMQAGFGAVAAAGMGQLGAAAAGALAYSQQLMALHGAQGVREGAVDGVGGVAGSIKATQVELVRGALLGCLKMLRQMSEALGELAVWRTVAILVVFALNVRADSKWLWLYAVCDR